MGCNIKVNERVVNTATYYTNYFFVRRSYLNYDRHIVCTAALLLACKKHDLPKKLPDLAKIHHNIYYSRIKQHSTKPPFEGKVLADYKEKITKAELCILKTLGFNIEVELPHDHLLTVIESLYCGMEDTTIINNISVAIANESMRSVALLCIPAVPISVACVILAGIICNMPRPDELLIENSDKWWTAVDPDLDPAEIHLAIKTINDCLAAK